ncbi:MAG: hypothetical protein K5886_00315 [Lachnospiraceae bacterium]|nr:hypothetical protein [Lachnospiraceae bacterium]
MKLVFIGNYYQESNGISFRIKGVYNPSDHIFNPGFVYDLYDRTDSLFAEDRDYNAHYRKICLPYLADGVPYSVFKSIPDKDGNLAGDEIKLLVTEYEEMEKADKTKIFVENTYVRKYTHEYDILKDHLDSGTVALKCDSGWIYFKGGDPLYGKPGYFSMNCRYCDEKNIIDLPENYEEDEEIIKDLDAWLRDDFCIGFTDKDNKEKKVRSIIQYVQYAFLEALEGGVKRMSYLNNVPTADDYSERTAQMYYILQYAYAYSYMYRECYEKVYEEVYRDLNEPVKVLSFGCGPCLDGFGLKLAQHRKGFKVVSYTGIDYSDWNKGFCFHFEDSEFVKSDIIAYLDSLDMIDANVLMFPRILSELDDDTLQRLKEKLNGKLKSDRVVIISTYRNGEAVPDLNRIRDLVNFLGDYDKKPEDIEGHMAFRGNGYLKDMGYGYYPYEIIRSLKKSLNHYPMFMDGQLTYTWILLERKKP